MQNPHLIPDMPDAEALLPWLRQIDANRWYTNYGPLVTAFERGLREILQAANPGQDFSVTTLATGHHALELGLQAMQLPPGGEVLLPAITFPSCPLAVRHAGLSPVLADIDAYNWQLTPEIARRVAARQQLAAIMPVAVYGVPVDAAAWDTFTLETKIPVLIDAAAAFEAQRLPRHCLVAHSFHATKPLGIGEGGALIGSAALIERVRQLTNFGTVERIAKDWGTNAKLSEYHAAVGLTQLARWPAIKQSRASVLGVYQAALAGQKFKIQAGLDHAVPSLLLLDVAPRLAADVMVVLRAQNIPTHQTYLPPLYQHPAFADLPRVTGDGVTTERCSQAEYLAKHLVGVPFHPFMTQDDVTRVADVLLL